MGVGVGGASAYGVGLFRSGDSGPSTAQLAFVPAGTMTAPLVFSDGRLAAYISFDAQLEVPSDSMDDVTARLPLLMHAVNMRTYREPLASGVDGQIPDVEKLRDVVMAAAAETYGPKVVRRVVVTRATQI